MSKPEPRFPKNYLPLNMNGMSGRMLRFPSSTASKRRREILLIYGHHASLERIEGLAEYLSTYGNITAPDLPGLGGMDSFYRINQKPSLDNIADYLAAFIKLRYKNKRLSIVGVSFGFLAATRMLQKYPDLAKKVDLLISVAGFVNKDEFRFKRRNYHFFRSATWLFARYLLALFIQKFVLRDRVIRWGYRVLEPKAIADKDSKVRGVSEDEYRRRIDFEVYLWQCNDIRSYMYTAHQMLRVDLRSKPVNLPVYHIAVQGDRYFDNTLVEEHMRTIYTDFESMPAGSDKHAPSVISTAEDAAVFFTPKIQAVLRKKR